MAPLLRGSSSSCSE